MKEYLKFNLNRYLRRDRNRYAYLCFVPLCILFCLVVYSLQKEVYNVYETSAQTVCEETCIISFYYPYTEGFYYDYIKINGQKFEVEEKQFGDVVLDSSNVGVQNIALKVKEYQGKNQEFVKLQIYKNKEKLLKKIIKIMKER